MHFPVKNAPEITRLQDIPDFLPSAGSMGHLGLSLGIDKYPPSTSDPATIEIHKGFDAMEISEDESSDDDKCLVSWADNKCLVSWASADELIDLNRQNRACSAHNFRKGYKFVHGQKHCITKDIIFPWKSDRCYDKTWVAVHGMDSICMVTRRQLVDMTRVDEFYQESRTNLDTMCSYASTVISEVEMLPYDDDFYNVDKLFRRYLLLVEKPFGVVCVVSDNKKVHEESVHRADGYDEAVGRANNFLKEKLAGGLAFTFENTVQTAISTFQHLCPEELGAGDIWVTTVMIASAWFEHMDLLQKRQHLAVIRGDTSSVGDFTSDCRVPRTYFERCRVLNPLLPPPPLEKYNDSLPSLLGGPKQKIGSQNTFSFVSGPNNPFAGHINPIASKESISSGQSLFSSGPGPFYNGFQ